MYLKINALGDYKKKYDPFARLLALKRGVGVCSVVGVVSGFYGSIYSIYISIYSIYISIYIIYTINEFPKGLCSAVASQGVSDENLLNIQTKKTIFYGSLRPMLFL